MKLMFKVLLVIIILATNNSSLFSQKRNYTQEADKAFNTFQYSAAEDLYKKAYSKVKSNKIQKNYILFQIAECQRLQTKFRTAEKNYLKLEKINYQKDNPKIFLHLGDIRRSEYKDIAGALSYYNLYKEAAPEDTTIETRIKSCEVGTKWLTEPTRYEISLFPKMNTKYNDWAPSWGNPNKMTMLFISSSREGGTSKARDSWTGESFSDIYVTEKPKSKNTEWPGEWQEPQILDEEGIVNSDGNEADAVANSKGSTIYFSRCGVEKKKLIFCKIYSSTRKGKGWGEAEEIKLGPDTFDFVNPTITGDELTMIFSSNIPGGYGGYDLWIATRTKKSKPFDKPKNLGPTINTFSSDMFPTLRNDTTLYFASKGHIGIGGYDLFKSIKQGDSWSEPQNLQSPINSENDEITICFDETPYLDPLSNSPYVDKGFFASNRKEGKSNSGFDIWTFKLRPLVFTLSGIIRDSVSLQPIPGADVFVTGSDNSSYKTITDEKGHYKFDKTKILHEVTYNISVKKQGYFENENSNGIETTVGLTENTDLVRDFNLNPLPKEPIILPDILFELAKWDLLSQYQDSLKGLYQIMVDNPTIIVELRSHTDIRPMYPFSNDTLSQRRAESCVNFLISLGINAERLIAKGYGEKDPRTLKKETTISINDKEYTFPSGTILTGEYIYSITSKEEQEAAHSLNRRTEFKIIRDDFVPPTKIDSAKNIPQKINFIAAGLNTISVSIDKEVIKGNCIINNRQMPFEIETGTNKIFISSEEIQKMLVERRVVARDFELKEKAINEDGSVIDNSTLYLTSLNLGEVTIENVEVVVVKGLRYPVVIGDKRLIEEFGEYTIDEKKKIITFKK